MFLEGTTIAFVLAVVVIRGLTTRHIQALRQRKVEVENLARRNEERHKGFLRDKEVVEGEITKIQKDVDNLQDYIQDIHEDLAEVQERNTSLEEQINS